MATPDDDTTTAPPPVAPPTAAATPDMLAQAQAIAQQFLPAPVQVDTTPVKRSWLSLLGEAVGGGKTIPMSPADEQRAGLRALGDFGTSLMAASHYQPGQTVFSNLAQGFQGAERSMTGSEQMASQVLAGQQGYQQQQLQNRLAALKEAIPLLRMQQAAGMPNPLAGNAPAPGTGIGATGAPIGGAAPAFTGDLEKDRQIIAQRESGGDPTALNYVAKADPTAYGRGATASGKYQFVNSTWAEGMKLAGLDASKYPTAMSAPEGVQDKVFDAVYGKYGTKPWDASTYKQNWVPTPTGQMILANMVPGSAPSGSKTATAPPAATTPPAPVARPTAAPAAPAGTIQGTPDTGGTQVGGPGALPGKIAPPGPAVPGDVKAMIGGMTGAGASPTTLAPGAATAGPVAPTIAQAGPTTVTPPAQPTPQTPTQGDQPPPIGGQTWEQFLTQHMPQPTPEETATWHQAPDPQTLAEAANAKTAAAQELSAARINFGAGSKEANTANERYQTASKEVGELQRQYSQTNATTLLDWTNKQKTLLAPLFKNQQDQAQAVAEADKQRAAAIALKTQEGQQAIDLANAQAKLKMQENEQTSNLASRQKVLEGLDTEATSAHENLAQLQLVKQLSDAAGQPGILASYPELRSWMVKMGIASDDQAQQWSAQQALDAASNKLTLAARQGSGMSRMTNMDLQFLQHTSPQSFNPQDWRNAQIAYLTTLYQRQQQFAGLVHRGVADGQSLNDAQNAADAELGPTIKTLPTANKDGTPMTKTDQAKWNFDNLTPNSFYKDPTGRLRIFAPGDATRPE